MTDLAILKMPEIMSKANDNLRYFVHSYPELMRDYPQKFVAIDNLKVIKSNDTLKELLKELNSENKYSDSMIIQFIDTKEVKLTL